ncbi:MAG: division/outer membrane stress-associated lipid-binding lipoprotein [Colwellia sp.]
MLLSIEKNNTTKKHVKITALLLLIAVLQGCAVAAIAVVATGASMASDRRTVGKQIDDQSIELSAHNEIAKQKSLIDNTNLQIISMNGSVLVIGQAPNTYLRDSAIKIIEKTKGVVQIHNQIRIGNTISVTTKTNDIWLTSKVKAALFSSDKIKAKDIKVVTENAEVFLMGIVSQQEADEAVNITRNISGVNRVFKAFEYL